MEARTPTYLGALAEEMNARSSSLAGEITDTLLAEIPELAAGGPGMRAALDASTRSNLELVFEGLGGDRTAPVEAPAEAREFVRLMAQLGYGLELVLRLYRRGHAITWEHWLELTQARVHDPDARTAVISEASRYMFEYVDAVAANVAHLFAGERETHRRGRELDALVLVRELLGGADAPSNADSTLDYALSGWHVGLYITGQDPQRAADTVAGALRATRKLVVPLSAELAWAWVGRARAFPRRIRLRRFDDAGIAFGEPASGLDGFRTTHAQAREAHTVRELTGVPVAGYADVGLLALTARDRDAARMFCDEELRGIDGDDARSRALRETLVAWFAAGHNGASAAAALGAHENTVANRLRTVERRTGRSLVAHRAELEVALRLRALLGSERGAASIARP